MSAHTMLSAINNLVIPFLPVALPLKMALYPRSNG